MRKGFIFVSMEPETERFGSELKGTAKFIRRFLFFVFAILLVFSGSAYSFADLSEVGIGARPLSLGRAYTALSSDGSGIFTNPAGLSDYPKLKIVSMTGRLINDVNYVTVGFSNSFRLGTIGLGYISASTVGIPLTTLTSTPTGDVISDPYAYTDYLSSIYYLTYSNRLTSAISFGLNFKYFAQNFSLATGQMSGGTGTGTEADLGIKLKPRRWLNIGCTFKNALPASMGGKFTWVKNNREESIPMTVNLGTYIKLSGPSGIMNIRGQNIALMAEGQTMPKVARPTLFKTGVEWWVTKGLALRSGVDQDFKAQATGGFGIENNITYGVGLKIGGFNFDYAYHKYGELTGNTSHFFSLGYIGFNEDYRSSLRLSPYDNGLSPILKKKPELRHFSDVPGSFWAKDPIEYLATLKIMQGFPDDTFKPNQPLTRAQIAVLLVKAKGFEIQKGIPSIFYDLPTDHWAAPYVNIAVEKDYLSGYPDGSYQPDKALTRSEGVAILARFASIEIPEKVKYGPYSDVAKDHWAAPAIYAAKKAGFLEFISSKEFNPDQPLTRAEAAEIISKTKFGREKIREFLKK